MQTTKHINTAAAMLVLAFACMFSATTTNATMQINYTDTGVVYKQQARTLEVTGEYSTGEVFVDGEYSTGEVFVDGEFYAYYSVDSNGVLTFEDEDGNTLHTLADVADEDAYAALAASILQQ